MINVHQDNLLNFNIHRGLIMAKCIPNYNHLVKPAILFKAKFNNLSGSGKISLSSTSDKTGVRVSLDQLDLSSMKTKIFEPKLPFPEAFEIQLIKSAISQLKPVINQYLMKTLFYLPENILPLAAAPVIKLRSMRNGYGYVEIISYCICDEETNTTFAICDKRSEICSNPTSSQLIGETLKKKVILSHFLMLIIITSFTILGSRKKALKSKSVDEYQESPEINFKTYLVKNQSGNISYEGAHLTSQSIKVNLFTLSDNNMIYMGIALAFVLVSAILVNEKREKIKENIVNSWSQQGRDFKSQLKSCKEKVNSFLQKQFGNRFKIWKTQDTIQIKDDVIQNIMLLSNGILAIVFAIEWNSINNPLILIHNKFKPNDIADNTNVNMSKTLNLSDIFETKQMANFADNLNFYTFWVNIVNSIIAFVIIIIWCVTVKGEKSTWMKVRLASCVSFLAAIFMVLALLIFCTYFDKLVVLKQNTEYFLTRNGSIYVVGSYVLNSSLNGISLMVISFTIVFLFHGVGGGLFCGTVIFR